MVKQVAEPVEAPFVIGRPFDPSRGLRDRKLRDLNFYAFFSKIT